ncbi:hypothetical protein CZ771_10825 [Actinomycetales bacterium JB111]|nr:hypothetical protein CZ771_10825 [Actinomycetales bacterium JB111]
MARSAHLGSLRIDDRRVRSPRLGVEDESVVRPSASRDERRMRVSTTGPVRPRR